MSIREVLKKHLYKMQDRETLIHEANGIMYSIVKYTIFNRQPWFDVWENGNITKTNLTSDEVLEYVLGF